MNIEKFKKDIPDLKGCVIGDLRIDGGGEVVAFVLKDKKGNKRYIMYFGDDLRVENYW